MSSVRLLVISGIVLIFMGLVTLVVPSQALSSLQTVSGLVTDGDSPVPGAIVQIQGTAITTRTLDDGSFSFTDLDLTSPIVVVAWAEGYYNGWATLNPGDNDSPGAQALTISLRPLPQGDHSTYAWFSFEGVNGSAACGLCHREYDEWRSDQHSRASTNPFFVTMYTGKDINGEMGQTVSFNYDGTANLPDPDLPYTGPGFLPDNPGGRAGNCATCHAPAASTAPNNQSCAWSGCHTSLTIERASYAIKGIPAMPIDAQGDAAEGVSCEICHKTSDVIVNPENNMPTPDMPGILSMRLNRPADEADQVFFGTLVDVTRPDSYLPLLSESRFCAACHFGVFGGVVGNMTVTGGTVIYNSYGEWLESPYSDPETGKTCQDCHMPESDANWFVLPERGGLVRDYAPLHNHNMPGANDQELLQNTVTMVTTAERVEDQIVIQVSITNDRAGHHVPTDAPMRSLILVVEAFGPEGETLALQAGPINPDFSGDYGDVPGKTFAKILQDDWTGETPTASFWRPTTLIEDSRIAALATDTSSYVFDAPSGDITVEVRLIYRRAFYELMQQKGWDIDDILMEQETLQVPANNG